MDTLGGTIRGIRKRLRLNQAEFGSRVGVNQATVAKYELDKIVPSTAVYMLIQGMASDAELPLLLSQFGNAIPAAGAIKSAPRLADSIRMIRERSGKTSVQFARDLGVSMQDLDAYLAGRVVPIDGVLRKLLPLAKGEVEKRPILKALETAEDLWDGWTAEIPTSNLGEFRAQAAQIIASGKEVPAALVKMLRQWSARANHPGAQAAFEKALMYLEVELGPVVQAGTQVSGGAKKRVG